MRKKLVITRVGRQAPQSSQVWPEELPVPLAERAEQLYPLIASGTGTREEYLELAGELAKQMRDRQSAAALSAWLTGHPFDAECYCLRGRRYLAMMQYEQGAADLEMSARLDPDNWSTEYHRGLVHFIRGDFARASQAFLHCHALSADGGSLISAANWCYLSLMRQGRRAEAEALVSALLPLVRDAACEVVVCPPFVDLYAVSRLVAGTNVRLGAQNVHFAKSGAYTGELSADMLKACGVEYVVIGHSERRQYFGETDVTVQKRVRAALDAGLTVILCVGEYLEQREQGVTGEVVAMSGGVGEKTGNLVLNRATDALRAPGSSFKPLAVYAPAIELGLITPSTLVNDAPREEVEMSQNQWYPNNSDFKYRGIIDIATGVRLSLNTVAAQVLDKLGLDASTNFLKNKLGITSLVPDDYNYASLALGELTNGISVLEMAQAYCTFDNSGIFTEARTYSRVTDAAGNIVLDNQPKTHVAMKSSTATNITSLLFSAANYGTGSESIFSGQAIAGKTGTSSYNWNRWFAGYTPYYVGVVWTGFDQPEQMYVYGNPAAQVWRRVMQQVHAGLEYKSFPAADWIGGDTQIFGDLTEAKEEQDNPSPSPSEEPAASESPDAAVSESPSVSTAPVVTDSPVATEPPVEPVEPVEPPANGGVFG